MPIPQFDSISKVFFHILSSYLHQLHIIRVHTSSLASLEWCLKIVDPLVPPAVDLITCSLHKNISVQHLT